MSTPKVNISKMLSLGGLSRELAPEHVVEALFTTIGCRLEPGGRGSRYPAVMDALYSGYLPSARTAEALRELQEIELALRRIPVRDVVWSLANVLHDDAGEPVNRHAGNAFEYFVDADGQPLILRLREGVQECLNTAHALRLARSNEARDGLVAAFYLSALGVAWMFLLRAFFPHWAVTPVYSRDATIPIWTFGMDLVMLGVAFAIVQGCPSVRDWFRRHQAALILVVFSAPIAWLVVCWRAGFLRD
jgi:transposase